MTTYKDMTNPELVAAYNAMVGALGGGSGLEPVNRFSDRNAGVRRCTHLADIITESARRERGDAAVVKLDDVVQSIKEVAAVEGRGATTAEAAPAPERVVTDEALTTAHAAEIELKSATVAQPGTLSDGVMISTTSYGVLVSSVVGDTVKHEWGDFAPPNKPRGPRKHKKWKEGPPARTVYQASRDVMGFHFKKPGNPKRPNTDGARHYDVMVSAKTVGAYLARFEAGKPRKTANQWIGNFVREGLVELVEVAE